MTDLVWEDPAPASREKGSIETLLTPLLSCPGRWARIRVNAKRSNITTLCNAIKGGPNRSRYTVPPGRWEAVTRKIYEGEHQGEFGLFARYLGPEEPFK